ncbi:hypothetical protein N2152v2_009527 [Parachlorella kessleri]
MAGELNHNANPGSQPSNLGHLLEQYVDRYAVGVICAASGLYILRCLPSVLFPQGWLMTSLVLLLGVALGVAGFVAALVYAFYQVTQPGSAPAHAPPTGSQQRQSRRDGAQEGGGLRRQVSASGDVPPHAFCKQGQLSGVMYTVTLSRFAPTDTIADWPPATQGPQAFAKKWRASVSQGTLVLTPLMEPSAPTDPQAKRQGAGKQATAAAAAATAAAPSASAASASQLATPSTAETAEPADASRTGIPAEQEQQQQHPGSEPAMGAAAAAAPAAKVGIPLEGCRVEVVAGGLKGRSRWIRRAPLLVSHPRWNLLDGERGFYVLAEDSASKQQWYHALSWWCDGGALRGGTIAGLYAAFCSLMAQRSALDYPQEESLQRGDPASAVGDSGSSGTEANSTAIIGGQVAARGGAGRRTWKAWGAQKMQVVKRRVQERRGRGGRLTATEEQQVVLVQKQELVMQQQLGIEAGGDAEELPGLAPVAVAAAAPSSALPSAAVFASLPGTSLALPQGNPASAQPAGAASAELNVLESLMDERWMRSTKIPMPPAIPQAVSRPLSPVRSPNRPRRSSSNNSFQEDDRAYRGAGGSGYTTPLLGSSPAKPLAVGLPAPPRSPLKPGDPLLANIHGLQQPASLPGTPPGPGQQLPQGQLARGVRAAASSALQPGQQQGVQQATLLQEVNVGSGLGGAVVTAAVPEQEQLDGEGGNSAPGLFSGGATGAQKGSGGGSTSGIPAAQESGAGLPPGMPPLVAADYAVNMLLTRWGFDLLRNPELQEMVKQRVQRRLDLLSKPDYVQCLEVVSVSMGSTVPTVRNFAALPTPDDAIWPQLVFDLYYAGTFTLTLETKVDPRDAAAWGRFDRALSRLEGRSPGDGEDDSAAYGGGGSTPRVGSLTAGSGGAAAASAPELGKFSPPGGEAGDEEGLAAGDDESAESAPALGSSPTGSGGGKKGQFMSKLRASAGRKLRQLAENTATRISRMPLRVSLTFSVLEATVLAWVPPPPGDRLFVSFLRPPRLVVQAKPELAGRLLKYSYHIAKVSSWIENLMRKALTKNMVFPGCSDFIMRGMLDLDSPHVADSLPGLAASRLADPATHPRQQQVKQQQKQPQEQKHGESVPQLGVDQGGSPSDVRSRSAPQVSSGTDLANAGNSVPQGQQEQEQEQQLGQHEKGLGAAPGGDNQEPTGSAAAGSTATARVASVPMAVPLRSLSTAGGQREQVGSTESLTATCTEGSSLERSGSVGDGRSMSASWPGLRPSLRPSPPGEEAAGVGSVDDGTSFFASSRRVTKSVSFQLEAQQGEDGGAGHLVAEEAAMAATDVQGSAAPAGSVGAGDAPVPAGAGGEPLLGPLARAMLGMRQGSDAGQLDGTIAASAAEAGAALPPLVRSPGAAAIDAGGGGLGSVGADVGERGKEVKEAAEAGRVNPEGDGETVAAGQPSERGHLVGSGPLGRAISAETGALLFRGSRAHSVEGQEAEGQADATHPSSRGSSSVPTSPAAGQPGSSRLVNRGLQYLQQHSQQAAGAPRDASTRSLTSADPDQHLASEAQQPQEPSGGGIKGKGSRMAKTMLSRMNQAGKALAQQYQQAQQARHQQLGGAGAGGVGASRAAAAQPVERGRLHSD